MPQLWRGAAWVCGWDEGNAHPCWRACTSNRAMRDCTDCLPIWRWSWATRRQRNRTRETWRWRCSGARATWSLSAATRHPHSALRHQWWGTRRSSVFIGGINDTASVVSQGKRLLHLIDEVIDVDPDGGQHKQREADFHRIQVEINPKR